MSTEISVDLALLHAKPPLRALADAIIIWQAAFHKTRRIHSIGVFYRLAGQDPANECSEWKKCLHCGADIEKG